MLDTIFVNRAGVVPVLTSDDDALYVREHLVPHTQCTVMGVRRYQDQIVCF